MSAELKKAGTNRWSLFGDNKWNVIRADPERLLGALAACKVVVIGSVQSGTKYISKVLSAAGLDVGHEIIRPDGISDGAYTFLDFPVPPYRKYAILHQVRDPIRTISAIKLIPYWVWARFENHQSWRQLVFVDIRGQDSNLLKCMKYWYAWNLKAESQADLTYRVEAINSVWDQICDLIGISRGGGLPAVPCDTNSQADAYAMDTWDDLFACDEVLAKKIISMARRYGYAIP